MRLRRCPGGHDGTTLAAFDEASQKWIRMVDAVASCGVEATKTCDCSDITVFLALKPEIRAAWKAVIAKYASNATTEPPKLDGLPFEPRSFRDAALFLRHMKQAVKGFTPVAMANGHLLQLFFGQIVGKKVRLPRLLGPARKPPYYVGNPLTFVPGGEARWPSHCAWLDYELEIALLLAARLDPLPNIADIEQAILDHGAFVRIGVYASLRRFPRTRVLSMRDYGARR